VQLVVAALVTTVCIAVMVAEACRIPVRREIDFGHTALVCGFEPYGDDRGHGVGAFIACGPARLNIIGESNDIEWNMGGFGFSRARIIDSRNNVSYYSIATVPPWFVLGTTTVLDALIVIPYLLRCKPSRR
jgi:hypothetical protein